MNIPIVYGAVGAVSLYQPSIPIRHGRAVPHSRRLTRQPTNPSRVPIQPLQQNLFKFTKRKKTTSVRPRRLAYYDRSGCGDRNKGETGAAGGGLGPKIGVGQAALGSAASRVIATLAKQVIA